MNQSRSNYQSIPETKGECAIMIIELKGIIQNNLQIAGVINPRHMMDQDDDSMEFMNDIF